MRSWNQILMDDHQATEKLMAALEKAFSTSTPPDPKVIARALDYFVTYVDRCHNHKEEDHLFPLLEKRGIPRQGGPLGVMLQEHEQSRSLLARLKSLAEAYVDGDEGVLGDLRSVFLDYASLLKSHFWKENDILFPMALRQMSDADAQTVISGIESVEAKFGENTRERYHRLAEEIAAGLSLQDLSFALDRSVLAAILNTLPVELSFVDADDTVLYFSHENHDKIFPRTRGAIGTKVQDCHPRKSLDKVNEILADFKANRSHVAEFWIDFSGRKIHIRYFAVRDESDSYLGCLEVVQDVSEIQRLKGERRLLG